MLLPEGRWVGLKNTPTAYLRIKFSTLFKYTFSLIIAKTIDTTENTLPYSHAGAHSCAHETKQHIAERN